jgi:site-specific recombinase XerD
MMKRTPERFGNMTELLMKPRKLTLQELPSLSCLGTIEGDSLTLERSPKGYKLKTPVTFPIDRLLAVGQRGLAEYVVDSLIVQRPRLIPWVLENQSLIELARYLLRSRSGSLMGFYVYANTVHQYSVRLGFSPDQIIRDASSNNKELDLARIKKHRRFLEDCLAELQDQGRSPGRIHSYAKHVRTFYRVNEIEIPCPTLPRPAVVRKDRAPKPEELQRLLDIADLREKVIISMLALAGFREGTLVRLTYSHVREDLEKGIVPIHIHVEAAITKGKYHDYDTFLGAEAATYLKLYLDKRRQGSPDEKMPPEEISDSSPLIRDAQSAKPRPVGEKQLYKIIHGLYHETGLLRKEVNGGYDLRVHSIRKFFKTQLMALGIQPDYVDYMMGHTVDVYHDIQSKDIEFLRNVYASAGLSIKPRASYTKLDMLKETMRAWGLEPEKFLTKEALAEPHRTYASPQEREEEEVRLLGLALRENLKKELLASLKHQVRY